MCMSGAKFLKEWQVIDKIIEWFFYNSYFTFYKWLIQEIITCRVSKIHKWIWGDMYDWGKFLKEWQVRDKIIESVFSQFAFNHLWMTQTQKIITDRVSKIHKCVYD